MSVAPPLQFSGILAIFEFLFADYWRIRWIKSFDLRFGRDLLVCQTPTNRFCDNPLRHLCWIHIARSSLCDKFVGSLVKT